MQSSWGANTDVSVTGRFCPVYMSPAKLGYSALVNSQASYTGFSSHVGN